MEPLTAGLIGIILIITIGGVWGTVILRGLMERRTLELRSGPDDGRLEELLEGYRQVEARLEHLEEEVGFYRELQEPKNPGRLPSGDPGASGVGS